MRLEVEAESWAYRTPFRISRGVEEALEFIEDDELVEVTPKSVRMRKRILEEKKRRREQTKQKMRDGTYVE